VKVFQFFITCKSTNNANNATHYVKLGKKRQESSKRNYYIIFPRVIIKAIIIMFQISDVDLLEQIYDSTTVCLAPNKAESATIMFDTGVAQGSITSPQLFHFFINALLRTLMATGQNQGISHGFQIDKN